MARAVKAKSGKKEFVEQIAKEFAERIIDDDGSAEPEREHEHEHEESNIVDNGESGADSGVSHEEKGDGMRGFSFVLAFISFIMVLLLGYVVYDMHSKVTRLTELQSNNSVAGDIARMQNTTDRITEAVKAVQQNLARISMDGKQNAASIEKNDAAIDEIKGRINQLIELMK